MRVVSSACALVVALAGSTGLGACNGSPSNNSSVSEKPAPEGATNAPDESSQVLARVGERTITLGDFVAALEHMDSFDRLRYQAPDRRKELLQEMIDVMLLADEARDRGYDKDPQAEQEMREILRDAVLRKARQAAPTPSDIAASDVAAYYDSHKADFHDPERRRVSAIVLSSETAAEATLSAAEKAVKDGNPESWGELVRARSLDPQAKTDVPVDLAGDLGFTSPPGDPHGVNTRIPEGVRSAVFAVPRVGDLVPAVVRATAADGRVLFYVVRLASRVGAQDRTLQDAERSIRVRLAQDRASANEARLIDDLRKQYPVQFDEAALAEVRVDTDAGQGR